MQRKAKIFMSNGSQAVRLPKEFQFDVQEVFIRKEGSDIVAVPSADGLVLLPCDEPMGFAIFHGKHRRPPSAGA